MHIQSVMPGSEIFKTRLKCQVLDIFKMVKNLAFVCLINVVGKSRAVYLNLTCYSSLFAVLNGDYDALYSLTLCLVVQKLHSCQHR